MDKLIIGLFCLVAVCGCGQPVITLNAQRSAIRSATDIGTTAYLDQQQIEDVAKQQEAVDEIKRKIFTFLETGNVANLPLEQVKSQLAALADQKYLAIINTIIATISTQSIDIDGLIGEDNVARMLAALYGVDVALQQYRVEDRQVILKQE